MSHPKHWESTELQELGEWQTGSTPRRSNDEYWGGEIQWVSPKDMKTARITDTEDHMTEKALEETNSTIIPPGSLIMVTRSGILEHSFPVAVNEERVTINQDLKALIPSSHISVEYLYYCLRSNEMDILRNCTKDGTTVASINSDSLYTYEVPTTSLTEQERIVDKIEKLFSKLDSGVSELENAKQQLEKYCSAVLKSAIEGNLTDQWRNKNDGLESGQEVLARHREEYGTGAEPKEIPEEYDLPENWAWGSIDQIADLESGQHIKTDKYNQDGEGTPYLTGPADFGKYSPTVSKWAPEPKAMAYKNDVLITVKGAGVGKTNVLKEDEVSISRQLMAIQPYEITPKFLYYYIQSQFHYFQRIGEGSTVPGLNRNQILGTAVPVLSQEEQEMVVNEIERRLPVVEEVQNSLGQELHRANHLRQSILKSAFEGKLVPQNPTDGSEAETPESRDVKPKQNEQQKLSEVTSDVE